jgi:fatty acid desaturase
LIILLCPVIAIVNAVWFGSELQRFTRRVSTFSSTSDIESFKAVVSRQMYAALAQIVLLAVPPILFFVGLLKGFLDPSDVIAIILPMAVVILVGWLYKQVENQARTIPAADDELTRQRDAIIETWLKKPFPDW